MHLRRELGSNLRDAKIPIRARDHDGRAGRRQEQLPHARRHGRRLPALVHGNHREGGEGHCEEGDCDGFGGGVEVGGGRVADDVDPGAHGCGERGDKWVWWI